MLLSQMQVSSAILAVLLAVEILIVSVLVYLVAIVLPVQDQGFLKSLLSVVCLVQDLLDFLGIDIDVCHISALVLSTHLVTLSRCLYVSTTINLNSNII